MTREEFICLREEAIKREGILLLAKGQEYRGEDDVLSNFKRGSRVNVAALESVWVLLDKQLCAIEFCIRTGKDSIEGFQSRIDDAVNYLHLMMAVYEEGKSETHPA